MMAGWITRIVTVTYGPRYERLSSYVPPRFVDVRAPTLFDEASLPLVLRRTPGYSGGPCGCAARAAPSGCGWTRALAELEDYIARFGANPLGLSARLGSGAKEGTRGRGPQDYIR